MGNGAKLSLLVFACVSQPRPFYCYRGPSSQEQQPVLASTLLGGQPTHARALSKSFQLPPAVVPPLKGPRTHDRLVARAIPSLLACAATASSTPPLSTLGLTAKERQEGVVALGTRLARGCFGAALLSGLEEATALLVLGRSSSRSRSSRSSSGSRSSRSGRSGRSFSSIRPVARHMRRRGGRCRGENGGWAGFFGLIA